MGCSCAKCVAACKSMPAALIPSDLEHIPHDKLCASEGTDIIEPSGNRLHALTIVPQQKPDGSCVFFDKGVCTIHEHKPYGCRKFSACSEDVLHAAMFSSHMYRSILKDADSDGPYARLWHNLPSAMPIAERKERYHQCQAKAERKRYSKKSKTRR